MDIILYNGQIHTMDEKRPLVRAIGIKDGLIACIGGNEEILSRKTAGTRLINVGGKCVIPGLNDSHLHLLGYAYDKSGADLSPARSVEDIVNLIRQYISEKQIPEGTAVFGGGFNDTMFTDGKFPTAADLDRASAAHPICVKRACRHAAVVNSMMMEMSGITPDTATCGGEILLTADGVPNGVLTENALHLVKISSGPVPVKEIKGLVRSVQRELAEYGITSVQTDDFSAVFPKENVISAYTELARERKMTFRVTQQAKALDLEDLEIVLNLPQTEVNLLGLFRVGPVKILADGSLGARTAYMQEDYHDAPGVRGVAIHSQAVLNEMLEKIHKKGMDAAVHAIGDGTAKMVLDAIEAAMAKHPRPEHRHGIVHAQITTNELLARFAALKVMAYIQPIFIHADHSIAAARVGAEKAATSYAFKTMLDSGVLIPLGTDCPVEPINPFNNIYCAVTRKGLDGSAGGFNPEQALTIHEAVRAYTLHGAYASREEHIKGKLLPGCCADIAVLSRDIFTEPAEAIPDTKSVLTIFGGNVIYEQSDFSNFSAYI